jgi:hypothetical protein
VTAASKRAALRALMRVYGGLESRRNEMPPLEPGLMSGIGIAMSDIRAEVYRIRERKEREP